MPAKPEVVVFKFQSTPRHPVRRGIPKNSDAFFHGSEGLNFHRLVSAKNHRHFARRQRSRRVFSIFFPIATFGLVDTREKRFLFWAGTHLSALGSSKLKAK